MNQIPEKGGAPLPPTAGAPISVPETTLNQPAIPFSRIDLGFAGLALLCGWIFAKNFSICFGTGITVFSLAFCAFALCYFRVKKVQIPKEGWIWLAVYLLSSFCFSIYTNLILGFVNFWFLLAAGVYWIAVCTSVRIGGKLDRWVVTDILHQTFHVPFGNFACGFRLLEAGLRKTGKGHGIFGVLAGAAVSIPVLAIILPCLISADGTFEQMARDLSQNLWRYVGELFWYLPVSVLVGCWLFGLVYGCVQKRKTGDLTEEILRKRGEQRHFLPVSVTGTMFIIVILVYVVFFFAQFQSLMVAVVNSAPEGTSFAEYARRGFFELCFVSAFNLFLLLFSRGFSRYTDGKENPFLKVLHGLLCVETLILIASALTKMGMYISRYGLTQLRFYTSWFMVTLIVVFVVLILSGFRPLQTAKILSITVIVSFLLLCWCNSDALIVRYNIGRWESGTLETLDLEDMQSNMPTAAVPQLIALWERTSDPQMKEEIETILLNSEWRSVGSNFIDNSIQSLISQKRLEEWKSSR